MLNVLQKQNYREGDSYDKNVLQNIPECYEAGDVTVAAVVTDSKTRHKASINDPSLMPRYAVLDPELTVGLPKQVTATTGMDALAHAVEAYTNLTV